MTGKALLVDKKSCAGMCVVLSLLLMGAFFVGCQVPPDPAPAQADASAAPDAAVTAQAPSALQDQQEMPPVEVSQVQSIPEKTEVVPAVPVTPPAAETPVAAALPPAPRETESVLAAVHLPDEDSQEPLDTSQTEEAASPARVAAETVKPTVPASSDTKIYVVDKVYDFGEITPLDTPEGTFQIKNIGTDTLHLTDVKVCCGAQHTLSSDQLAPGDTSVLTVKYRGTSVGPFEKYLTVYSNDAAEPAVKLTIKGTVVRHLTWTPDRFKLFLDQDNGGCAPIKITSTDGKPFALTSFSATEDCLTATVDPNKMAKEFVLSPTVDLKKLSALKMPKGIVRIKHTHPGCDTILLNYDLVKRYAFSPQRFLVLNADPSRVRIQRLNILDNYADSLKLKAENGDEPTMFTIEGVACQKGSAVLKSAKQITDGYQLTFEITPPDPAGQRLFQDLIAITLSTGDDLIVPINGIYSMAALSAAEKQE